VGRKASGELSNGDKLVTRQEAVAAIRNTLDSFYREVLIPKFEGSEKGRSLIRQGLLELEDALEALAKDLTELTEHHGSLRVAHLNVTERTLKDAQDARLLLDAHADRLRAIERRLRALEAEPEPWHRRLVAWLAQRHP
jgi:hypothetical protein